MTLENVAFVFPGQGSQAVGMGKALSEEFEVARTCFDTADRILGFALSEICYEGPEEKLRQTLITQPALYVHSCAALEVLKSKGMYTLLVKSPISPKFISSCPYSLTLIT